MILKWYQLKYLRANFGLRVIKDKTKLIFGEKHLKNLNEFDMSSVACRQVNLEDRGSPPTETIFPQDTSHILLYWLYSLSLPGRWSWLCLESPLKWKFGWRGREISWSICPWSTKLPIFHLNTFSHTTADRCILCPTVISNFLTTL